MMAISKRLAIIAIVLMFCIPMDAMARNISDFDGPSKNAVVDMAGAGSNANGASILWNYTAKPLSATLNITPASHTVGGTDYPVSPSINIAGAGDPEWAYAGKGYGMYGLQEGLADENASIQKVLNRAGRLDTSLLLPSDAAIKSASIDVRGDVADLLYTEDYIETHSIHRVAYSKRFNTLFSAESGYGIIAQNVGDGSLRFLNSETEPAIPSAVNHILMDDASGQLFIATSSGLYILNWTDMRIVTVLNPSSNPHTITFSINYVFYDSSEHLLALADGTSVSIFNYTPGGPITLVNYILISSWTVNCVYIDRSVNAIWIGTGSGGLFTYNMTTFLQERTHTPWTTPSIPGNSVRDIIYDRATDRLYVGTYTTWGAGGVSIYTYKTNTKVTDITTGSTPSIAQAYVWGMELDAARNDLYVSTEAGVNVFKVNPLSAVVKWDSGTTPRIPAWTAYDIAYNAELRWFAVGSYMGATLINTSSSTNVIMRAKQTRGLELPFAASYEHITDTVNGRVFVRYNLGVSIINLTTGLVERNITGFEILGGNNYDFTTAMRYDAITNWIIVGYSFSGSPRLGIYNLSSSQVRAYYSTGTTPALGANQIADLFYDNSTDIVFISQSGTGVTLLNLTTNTTFLMSTAAAPPFTLPTNWVWDMHYSEKAKVITIGYWNGVSLYNLTAGTVVSLDSTSTTPRLSGTNTQGVYYDADTTWLFYSYVSGVDVINMSSMTVVGKYSATSTPSLSVNGPVRLMYYPSDGILFLSDALGAIKFDMKNNVTIGRYDVTTTPALIKSSVLSYDKDPVRGWDIVAMLGAVQIIKRGVTPLDLELRLGDKVMWNGSGVMSGTYKVSGIASKLQASLSSLPGMPPDAYGNVIVNVPVRLSSQRGGILNISNISIEYSHTATTMDLTSTIQAYLNTTTSTWDHKIPVTVTMASAGKLTLDGLNVTIDEAPFFDPFPTNLWMYENSVAMKLLDIYGYIMDDYDVDADVVIAPRAVTNATRVDVGLLEGRYLFVDSKTKPAALNWTGEVQLVFDAMDTNGLVRTSPPLIVRVEPLQDIYITSEPLTKATEDELYVYRVRAYSHRGLELNYSLDVAPLGMLIDNGTGTVTWTPVNGQDGDRQVSVRVTDGIHDAIQNYTLTVQAVNDAPVVASYFEYTAYESVPLVVDMATVVTDVDDPVTGLTLRPTSTYASVSGMTMTFLYPKGSGIGEENVTVIISDGKDTAYTNILIHVMGVFKVDPLPDMEAFEGTPARLDVAPYIHDPQGRTLTVSADSLLVTVNGTELVFLYPVGSGMSEDVVTVRIADGWGVNDTLVKVRVKITAVFPTVSIAEPADRAKLGAGSLKVSGTAGISSGILARVEVQLDDGNWISATGTSAWSVEFDISGLPAGVHYLRARSLVGNVSSPIAERSFIIEETETSEVDTSAFMMMGLAIGLIIAIIVAVVTYVVAKKSASRAPPPHSMVAGRMDDGYGGQQGPGEAAEGPRGAGAEAGPRQVQKRKVRQRSGAGKAAEMERAAPPPEIATTESAAAMVAGGTTTFDMLEAEEPKTKYIEEAPPEPELAPEPEPAMEETKKEDVEEEEKGDEEGEEEKGDEEGEEEKGDEEGEVEEEEEEEEGGGKKDKEKAERKKEMDSLDAILAKLNE